MWSDALHAPFTPPETLGSDSLAFCLRVRSQNCSRNHAVLTLMMVMAGMQWCMQVLTLLFGVYDNSKILSHTLHQLACHPGAQQAARAEVDTAWGGQPPRTLQALISLKYLHACLQVGFVPSNWPQRRVHSGSVQCIRRLFRLLKEKVPALCL